MHLSVSKASLRYGISGEWWGSRVFYPTSLLQFPLPSGQPFSLWRIGLCHLSWVVSVSVPVTQLMLGWNVLGGRVSETGLAQSLSSKCSASWEEAEETQSTVQLVQKVLEERGKNSGKGRWRLIKSKEPVLLVISQLKPPLFFLPHLYHCLFTLKKSFKKCIHFKRELYSIPKWHIGCS